jgi:hypothetical protein
VRRVFKRYLTKLNDFRICSTYIGLILTVVVWRVRIVPDEAGFVLFG